MTLSRPDADRLRAIVARAASLAERATSPSFEPLPSQDEAARGARRDRWLKNASGRRRAHWDAVQAARGLDPNALDRSLDDVRLRPDDPGPDWAQALATLLDADFGRSGWIEPEVSVDPGSYALAFAPFLAVAARSLEGELAPGLVLREGARRGLLAHLRARWTSAARFALQRELHVEHALLVAKQPDATITPRDLARARLGTLAGWLRFLELYPALGRILGRLFVLWEQTTRELALRLAADRELLETQLLGKPGAHDVSSIELGRGDPHAGGRTVATIGFASGARVVYKPKDLAIAAWFQELSRELSQAGLEPALPARKVIARQGYAWDEHVAPAPCRDRAGAERFYARIGALVRVLQVLDGSDVHDGNIIVRGDEPVIVDLETVAQPRPATPGTTDADRLAHEVVRDSPLALTLLPEWTLGDPGRAALAQGGLVLGGKRQTPSRVPSLKPPGKGAAVAPDYVEYEERPTVPVVAGKPATGAELVERAVAGYLAATAVLEASGPRLGALLARAAALEVRFVPRRTQVYANVLADSLAAPALKDGRDRDLVLERLLLAASGPRDPVFPVVLEEIAALRDLDIPLFTARLDEPAIRSGSRVLAKNFFARPALDGIRERLAKRDPAARARDADVIRSAFATVHGPWPGRVKRLPGGAPPDDVLLARAIELGDLVASESFGRAKGWLALCEEPAAGVTRLGILPTNLFGTSGLSILFAALHRATGEARFRDLALETLAGMSAVARRLPGYWRSRPTTDTAPELCGPFLGWAAHLYAPAVVASLLGDEKLAREARALIPALPIGAAERRGPADVVCGTAGVVLALLATREPAGIPLAERLGERLLETATSGFPVPPYPRRTRVLDMLPETAPSAALALAALARREPRFAPEGLVPRLLASAGGSPGNLLAGLAALEILPAANRRELEADVQRALNDPALAPLERLELALARGRDERFRTAARAAAGEVLERQKTTARWLPESGFPDRHNLSVVGGLAGIALAFVRLARPGLVPSVRVLEPA